MASSATVGNSTLKRNALFFLETGLYFVLCESLLRRAFPSYSSVIQGFKFVYFPLLYACTFRLPCYRARYLPTNGQPYIIFGAILTCVFITAHPIVALLGLFVNLLFVPACALSAYLFRDKQVFLGFCRRATIFVVLLAGCVVVQSRLSANHWLNLQLDGVTASFGYGGDRFRVNGTFQYPTVFGNACIGLMICCIATCLERTNARNYWIGMGGIVSTIYCGYMTGSRIAWGSLVLCAGTLLQRRDFRSRLGAWSAVLFIALVPVALFLWDEEFIRTSVDRVQKSRFFDRTALERVGSGGYFGGMLSGALQYSNGVGIGYGPATMGVLPILVRIGWANDLPRDLLLATEGGYGNILLETGLFGLFLFGWFALGFFKEFNRSTFRSWLGLAVGTWLVIGNLPLPLLEITTISVLWWILAGAWWGGGKYWDTSFDGGNLKRAPC